MQEGRSKEKLDAILTVSIKRIDTGFNVNTTTQSNLDSRFKALVVYSFKFLYFQCGDKPNALPLIAVIITMPPLHTVTNLYVRTCTQVRCIFIVQ